MRQRTSGGQSDEMWPQVFKIGPVPVNSYGLLIVIGFLLALYVGRRETLRRGLPDRFSDMSMAMLISGIVGGRIYYYFQFYESSFSHKSFLAILYIWEGGLVFYGGAIGGLLGGLGFLLWKRLPVAAYLDVASLVAPIGMAAGRLGCFLNGCCYGRRCSAEYLLGVKFPEGSAAAHQHEELGLIAAGQQALPVHPVQLYQSVHDFLLFFLMVLFHRRVSAPLGAGMPMLFVFYAIGRFVLEGLRGDHQVTWSGLTTSQNISVGLFALFVPLLGLLFLREWRRAGRP
ncbi:MAG: prolipoprotein diacylglyceryl transferase [Planctomycetota bacterium]|nr:prolipoprotein diacylglyceryl transferase [Planctomycetota bacterium]